MHGARPAAPAASSCSSPRPGTAGRRPSSGSPRSSPHRAPPRRCSSAPGTCSPRGRSTPASGSCSSTTSTPSTTTTRCALAGLLGRPARRRPGRARDDPPARRRRCGRRCAVPSSPARAADLALSAEATARVLREEHGVADLDVADAVHGATAGWPVLVHLAADVAATPGADAAHVRSRLAAADSPCRHWLADRVLTGLDAVALRRPRPRGAGRTGRTRAAARGGR